MDRINPYESPRPSLPNTARFPRWACVGYVLAVAVPVVVGLYFNVSTFEWGRLLAFISIALAAPYVVAAVVAPLVLVAAGTTFRSAFYSSLPWTSLLFAVFMVSFGVFGLLYELGLV